ncbi:MAG TPA: AsmA-like C-terminal region-containing protein [Nitrospiraceae bacterium]|nr:AsmA-like C-terminal region-containing protein [Nitrospiraceae bacterium]
MSILIGVVLVVGVIISLPFLIDLNKYQDQYKPLLEDALNRKVQLQDIRLTIWPQIGARVAGFAVLDDPAFGSSHFTSLKSLDVSVKLMPLLGGKVEVEGITLRDPVITVIKNKNGVLNVSTIGRTGVRLPQTPSRAPIPSTEGPLKILALLAVDRISITGGTVTYRDLSAPEPTEYILQDMALLLQSVRLGHSPNLHVEMMVQPFNMPAKLDGTFGPLKESTDIDAINLKLALGKTDFAITGKMVGRNANLNISAPIINTAHLPVTLPIRGPIEVKNLQVTAEVQGQDILVPNCSLQVFDGQVTVEGKVTSGSETPPFTGRMTIEGMQLGPALSVLASAPVSISGTAGVDLAVQGRGFSTPDIMQSLEALGHVVVKDGKIEGVNLLQETTSLLKAIGVSLDSAKITVFSTIETDLSIKKEVVHVQRLLINSHDFQATGGGTIGFDQTLNLTMNLNLSEDLSRQIVRSTPATKLAMREDRLSLPLIITGTTSEPSYGLDTKKLSGKAQEQMQKKIEEAVGGLLKGETKPQDLKQQGRELLKGLLRP